MSVRNVAAIVAMGLLACGANAVGDSRTSDERTPVLEMRADGGEGGMGDVVGLGLLADGSVVVGDAANAQLVRIADNGALVSRVGRRGAAMGEYSRLQWIGTCGATAMVVHDIALSRLSSLNEQLAVLTTKTIPKAFDSRDVAGCLSDGRVVILNDSFPRPPAGVLRRPLAIVAFDTKTNKADTLRRFRGNDMNNVRHLGTSIAVPLGARTFVSLAGARVFVVESDRDSLWRYDGGAWKAVAMPGIPAAQSPTPLDDQRARQVLSWAPRTAQDRAFVPNLLAETKTAAVAPRIDGIIGADDGTAWVGLKPNARGQRDWIAYDANGKRVASTQFVWTFEPRLVLGERWFGVQRDSIGVEIVVRYRLTRNN